MKMTEIYQIEVIYIYIYIQRFLLSYVRKISLIITYA